MVGELRGTKQDSVAMLKVTLPENSVSIPLHSTLNTPGISQDIQDLAQEKSG